MLIKKAMILAAGRGERMRPLTDTCPKPLISVGGVPMIDRILDHLDSIGVQEVIVNTSYLGSKFHEHLSQRHHPRILFSDEEAPLETGGGVLKAIPTLGNDPFFVINGDVVWSDDKTNCLREMTSVWREDMKALLLVVPKSHARGYQGDGDYHMRSSHHLVRKTSGEKADYVFSGIQILHPSAFNNCEPGRFSLNFIYDTLEKEEALYGLSHKGLWFHVGTPEHLAATRAWFDQQEEKGS